MAPLRRTDEQSKKEAESLVAAGRKALLFQTGISTRKAFKKQNQSTLAIAEEEMPRISKRTISTAHDREYRRNRFQGRRWDELSFGHTSTKCVQSTREELLKGSCTGHDTDSAAPRQYLV